VRALFDATATCAENSYRVLLRILLRARRDRPRGRLAAEQRDELAALDSMEMHLLPHLGTGSIPHWPASSQGLAALRDFDPA
jgi:hypothetical protein